jgi:hypothetical protein
MQMLCEHFEKCWSCERIEFLKEKNNVNEILKILEDLKKVK